MSSEQPDAVFDETVPLVRIDAGGIRVWYELHADQEYVEIGFQGQLDVESAIAAHRGLTALPGWTPRFSRLVHYGPGAQLGVLDLTELEAMKAALTQVHLETYGERAIRAANVVDLDHNRPIAHLWESLNVRDSLLQVRFSPNRDEAVAWLTEPDWMARP